MNKNRGWCILMGVIGYILGISCCFTLLLIPVAIYCFIGAGKYMGFAELTDAQLAMNKQSLVNWSIFFSIVGFPVGLVSIIIPLRVSPNVTVYDVKDSKEEIKQETTQEEKQEKYEPDTQLTKLETIEKLQKFKEDGLITEEEFEKAKKEVIGDKKGE